MDVCKLAPMGKFLKPTAGIKLIKVQVFRGKFSMNIIVSILCKYKNNLLYYTSCYKYTNITFYFKILLKCLNYYIDHLMHVLAVSIRLRGESMAFLVSGNRERENL